MSLRTMGSTVRLTDYKGELIALRYVDEQEITMEPDWAEGPITRNIVRAEVVHVFEKDGVLTAKRLGRSLVFQEAIANDLRGTSDWAFGRFDEFERPTEAAPDATMYELAIPEDVNVDDVETAFEKAGIAL